jgi:hypothetical protein
VAGGEGGGEAQAVRFAIKVSERTTTAWVVAAARCPAAACTRTHLRLAAVATCLIACLPCQQHLSNTTADRLSKRASSAQQDNLTGGYCSSDTANVLTLSRPTGQCRIVFPGAGWRGAVEQKWTIGKPKGILS